LREHSAVVAKGRERADSILEAARQIIVLDGFSNFTMRKVAARVGIHLSNLQHYFPDRSALLRELLAYLNRRYSEDYAALIAVAGNDYEKQLRILIDAVLEDGRQPITRGLYFQFWALSSNDEYTLQIMEAGYTRFRKTLAAAIRAMNPSLGARELHRRAILVQALIEGAHYLLRNRRGVLVPPPGSFDTIRREAMRIAKRPGG
jgi:TetR/AcrR family transcriptional regulator